MLTALQGKILFKTDRGGRVEIYQMNADGSEQIPLEPERAYLYNEAVRWEAFSPNGQETIVVRGGGQLDLWRVNIASGSEIRITSEPAADYDPVWSPVDNQVIFVSERTGSGDLYLLNLDGDGVLRLTLNEGNFDKHPSWSLDGKKVVFWSDRGWNRNWQIWLLDLDTQESINLSNNAFEDWDPVWVK
jgi:TolB protein